MCASISFLISLTFLSFIFCLFLVPKVSIAIPCNCLSSKKIYQQKPIHILENWCLFQVTSSTVVSSLGYSRYLCLFSYSDAFLIWLNTATPNYSCDLIIFSYQISDTKMWYAHLDDILTASAIFPTFSWCFSRSILRTFELFLGWQLCGSFSKLFLSNSNGLVQ